MPKRNNLSDNLPRVTQGRALLELPLDVRYPCISKLLGITVLTVWRRGSESSAFGGERQGYRARFYRVFNQIVSRLVTSVPSWSVSHFVSHRSFPGLFGSLHQIIGNWSVAGSRLLQTNSITSKFSRPTLAHFLVR